MDTQERDGGAETASSSLVPRFRLKLRFEAALVASKRDVPRTTSMRPGPHPPPSPAPRGAQSSRPVAQSSTHVSSRAPCIFLLTGEGAHAPETDVHSLRASPSWSVVETEVVCLVSHTDGQPHAKGLEGFLIEYLGDPSAPNSPLISTVVNILNANRWWCVARDLLLGSVRALGAGTADASVV